MKMRLQASYDQIDQRFIVTYNNQFFGSSDWDVWAIVTDNLGNKIAQNPVNFTTAVDTQPSVAWVDAPNGRHWLVSYMESGSPGTAIVTNWVDPSGNVSANTTVVPNSAGLSVAGPVAAYSEFGSNQKILLTWATPYPTSSTAEVSMTFLDPTTLAASSIVTTGNGVDGEEPPSVTCAGLSDSFAVAWRESNADGTSPSVKIKVFPPGCRTFSCAAGPRTVVGGANLTNVSRAVKVVPFGGGFDVTFGCSLTSTYGFTGLCTTYTDGNGVDIDNLNLNVTPIESTTCGMTATFDAAGEPATSDRGVFIVYHPPCTAGPVHNVMRSTFRLVTTNQQSVGNWAVSDQ